MGDFNGGPEQGCILILAEGGGQELVKVQVADG